MVDNSSNPRLVLIPRGLFTFLLLAFLSIRGQASLGQTVLDFSGDGAARIIGTTGTIGHFGSALASGDLNGDGYDDLAIAAPGDIYTGTAPGRVFVIHGNEGFYQPSGIPLTEENADWLIHGPAANDLFGYSMAIFDFDSDGVDDLAIGAPGYAGDSGGVWVFFGRSTEEPVRIDLSTDPADIRIVGPSGSELGTSLTWGDFNGDGRLDLAMGAAGYTGPGNRSGCGGVFLLFGRNRGEFPGEIAIASGQTDFSVLGRSAGNRLGISIAAGDINGSGRADLFCGASGYGSGGGAFLFFGNAGWGEGTWTGIDLGAINVKASLELESSGTGNLLGEAVSVGDFNADGVDDLAIGARAAPGSHLFAGRVYLVLGKQGMTFQPWPVRLPDDPHALLIYGPSSQAGLGETVLLADLDMDGSAELIASTRGHRGDVYGLRGKALSPDGKATRDLAFENADLKLLDNSPQPGGPAIYGTPLVAGDWDGNGIRDLALGSALNGGTVHIVRGRIGGDMDGNGIVNEKDLLRFIKSRIAGDGTADFNRNGNVDGTDLFGLMQNWHTTVW